MVCCAARKQSQTVLGNSESQRASQGTDRLNFERPSSRTNDSTNAPNDTPQAVYELVTVSDLHHGLSRYQRFSCIYTMNGTSHAFDFTADSPRTTVVRDVTTAVP